MVHRVQEAVAYCERTVAVGERAFIDGRFGRASAVMSTVT